MTRLGESYITRCSSIFECIYFACDQAPSTNQSLIVRSTASPALSLSCGSAASSGAGNRPMKSISTGRGPPRRYSSQKARLGASTSSHDPKRVESGTEEASWGRLTGMFRWRLLRQRYEYMWPVCDPPPTAKMPCVALTRWPRRLLLPWVWCATIGGHLLREAFWHARI